MSRRWRNFQGSIDSACWKGIWGITGHNVEREEIKMWQKKKKLSKTICILYVRGN